MANSWNINYTTAKLSTNKTPTAAVVSSCCCSLSYWKRIGNVARCCCAVCLLQTALWRAEFSATLTVKRLNKVYSADARLSSASYLLKMDVQTGAGNDGRLETDLRSEVLLLFFYFSMIKSLDGHLKGTARGDQWQDQPVPTLRSCHEINTAINSPASATGTAQLSHK